MPLNLPDKLPAIELLRQENIFVMNQSRAEHQDIRPLKIVILNLMPAKIATETDLIRLLSNSPLQIEIDFLKIKGHVSKNTPIEHMQAFYKTFDEISKNKYDGMIITGAPVEHLPFEDFSDWDEIQTIFQWSAHNVTSTIFICWAAMAGLYYFYDIPKHPLEQKLFGVFDHCCLNSRLPFFRGFDDCFKMPHSRHMTVRAEDIAAVEELSLIACSEEAGAAMVMARRGRQFFVTGHGEYSRHTLDTEYKRDLAKGLTIAMPRNYYPADDPQRTPMMAWTSAANLMFSNWLNYYVYQETIYDINAIR